DTAGLKKFVQRAAKRFPKNTLVQGLAQNVFDYLDAVGNPRMPGDSIPELVLHDDFGGNFSTFSLKGRYVYIDIWATFCDECIKNEELVRKAKQMFPPGKFEAVSIAIDDQKEDWLKIIKANGYTWPQLIDEKMWQGKAFKILRFNAIPYNFLIGPDGRLIAKNIKKDSVIAVIQQVMK
ncbi:MAG TPA: TlpA disulfide reductase family protein, partial [Chitinophagaceae bacterium]|nr:TlpA disulfide reductase family protein [Chitinophagaceae bacterium]